ncbi:MAG: hypothetical protein ABIT96_00885, partial [Ferruginibacter sp.]
MQVRNSFTHLNKIYFWTATINNWQHLLSGKVEKEIILNSLKFLSDNNLVTIYGFVIMPNHIHLIWQQHEKNGKEMAKGSFLKFTAHEFKKRLLLIGGLENYKVDA